MTHLHCIGAACGATFDLHTPLMACPKCGELLEVVVDRPKADAAALKTTVVGAAALVCSGGCERRVALPRGAAAIRSRARRDAARGQCADGARAACGGVCRRDASALQASGMESDRLLQRPGDDDGHDGGAVPGREGGGLRFHGKHGGVAGGICGARRRGGTRVSAGGTGIDEQAGAGAGFRRGDCGGRTAASTMR